VTVLIQRPDPPAPTPSANFGPGGGVVQGQGHAVAVGVEGRADPFTGLTAAALGLQGKPDQTAGVAVAPSDTSLPDVVARDRLFGDPVMGGLLRGDLV
jgi:hypothetical protein